MERIVSIWSHNCVEKRGPLVLIYLKTRSFYIKRHTISGYICSYRALKSTGLELKANKTKASRGFNYATRFSSNSEPIKMEASLVGLN